MRVYFRFVDGFYVLMFIATALAQDAPDLPTCSNDCVNQASTDAACAIGDWNCLCANQKDVVGNVGILSSATACLVADCGLIDAGATQVKFGKFCAGRRHTTSTTSTQTTTSLSSSTTTASTASSDMIPPIDTSSKPGSITIFPVTSTPPSSTVSASTSIISSSPLSSQSSAHASSIPPIATSTSVSNPVSTEQGSSTTSASAALSSIIQTTSESSVQQSTSDVSSSIIQSTFQTITSTGVSTTDSPTTTLSDGSSTPAPGGVIPPTSTDPGASTDTANPSSTATDTGAANPALSSKQSGLHLSNSTIAGIVFLAVGFIALLVAAIVLFRRSRRKKKNNPEPKKDKKGMERLNSASSSQAPTETNMSGLGFGFLQKTGTEKLREKEAMAAAAGAAAAGDMAMSGALPITPAVPLIPKEKDEVRELTSVKSAPLLNSDTAVPMDGEPILARGRSAGGGDGPFFPMRERSHSRRLATPPDLPSLKELRQKGQVWFQQFRPKSYYGV